MVVGNPKCSQNKTSNHTIVHNNNYHNMKLRFNTSLLSALTLTVSLASAFTNSGGADECIRYEEDLRRALTLAKPKEELVLCKNNIIYLSSPIKVDNVDARIVCQNQDNCKIIGRKTVRLFDGAPKYLSWDTVFFQNDARALVSSTTSSSRKTFSSNGACHNYEGGEVHFDGCTFSKCQTAATGGAMAVKDTTVSFVDSYFQENTARADGGAIAAVSGTQLVFIKTDFKNNYAGNDGGAVFLEKSTVSFTTSKFEKNSAEESGGAIYDEGNSVVFIADSHLTRNVAKRSFGGAIFLDKSTASVTESILDYNTAKTQGGAIYDKEGSNLGAFSTHFEYNEAQQLDAGAFQRECLLCSFLELRLCL